jgi:hypothetical protein
MEQSPYTPTQLPKANDYLQSALGNNSNNEEGNPYVGQPSAPASEPSMGPRFQAMANAAGMGGAARMAAPIASAAMSATGSAVSPAIPAAASAVAGAVGSPSFARFMQYLNGYKGQKSRDFSKAGSPENIDDLAARVAMRESNGEFNAANPYSSARGGFQYLGDTWGGHGGFDSADKAPPEMQYNRFVTDLGGAIKRNGGSVPVGILSHFEGEGATKKILKNPNLLYQAPGTHNADETGYKRIRSVLGAQAADAWVSDHSSKLASAQNMLDNVYNVASTGRAP